MKRKSILACAAVLFTSLSQAQVPSLVPNNGIVPAIFNSSGGSYDNPVSYFRYEWSFGEVLLIDAMAPPDSSILLTHGVLQPCTDVIGNSPPASEFAEGEYKVFPNPTSGKFELDFFVTTPGMMTLQLINSIGQILESRSYHYDGCCRIELFDLGRYPDGLYFIVADLKPDFKVDNIGKIRHSGFKVIKLSDK